MQNGLMNKWFYIHLRMKENGKTRNYINFPFLKVV